MLIIKLVKSRLSEEFIKFILSYFLFCKCFCQFKMYLDVKTFEYKKWPLLLTFSHSFFFNISKVLIFYLLFHPDENAYF